MTEKTIYPCVRLAEGELEKRIITCGDPERAEKIAGLLEDSKCLQRNREFHSFSGKWNGVPVSIVSHGVGAGGAAIAFESMMKIGAKAIIRVGTCGGMQDGIDAGSIVIGTGACRDEGVTERMLPAGYPAVCDCDVVLALSEAAKKMDIKCERGIIMTNALFYAGLTESNVKLYARAGVKAMENEVAPLLVLGGRYGVKTGCILTADAKAFELVGPDDYVPDTEQVKRSVDNAIIIALNAISSLSL